MENISEATKSGGVTSPGALRGQNEDNHLPIDEGFDMGTPDFEVLARKFPPHASSSSGDSGFLAGGSSNSGAYEEGMCGFVMDEAFGGERDSGSLSCSLKTQVIDGPAVVDVSESGGVRDHREVEDDGGRSKKKETGKRVRKEGKREKGKTLNFIGLEKGLKIVYTRQEMKELRFVDVGGQWKMWQEIYSGLAPFMKREYDELVGMRNQKQHGDLVDPLQAVARSGVSGMLVYDLCPLKANYDAEAVSSFDDVCNDSGDKDGNYAMDKCSEYIASDDDYDSIRRPAFMVEGEPDFDSGLPEDGLEYLRRVRWEASQIPDVKVAKLDDHRIKNEQTVYMPQIPDIEKCPVHLAPSKQWEDEFIRDFSEIRLAISRLMTPWSADMDKLQSLSTTEKHFSAWAVISEADGPNNNPTLSAVLGMDLATRVKMLTRRISLFEQVTSVSKSDCLWLFALCATVDTPLDADTCASLRSLLRTCAKLLASKSEPDDEVVMLSILSTITGKYFGQSES